ncbi:MAG: malonate decarboxylase holo-[acyl-carrier-protein] synthase [bacterium]|nr:malonate decarboxylase holo-[acyl-carrier-protein] synthase [bacterium]
MREYRRHDMLNISFAGRSRIFYELIAQKSDIPVKILSDVMLVRYNRSYIPAIVRRGEHAPYGFLNVGFSCPQTFNNNRVRIASTVKDDEILDLISPYVLPFCEYEPRNGSLHAAKDVAGLPETRSGQVGIVGSAAMEIVTGCHYTNGDSDLDIIIKDRNLNEISETYTNLMQIGQARGVSVDIEIQLKNGYGIKAQELFIGSHTLLGKSLFDVQLLERAEVINLLQ